MLSNGLLKRDKSHAKISLQTFKEKKTFVKNDYLKNLGDFFLLSFHSLHVKMKNLNGAKLYTQMKIQCKFLEWV